ncbi:MAG: hypothetical protein ACN6OP_28625, partial [Pseudomonadales bacterium]
PDRKVGRLFDAQTSKESLERQRACRMLWHQAKALRKESGRKENYGTKQAQEAALLVNVDASGTREVRPW